MNLIRFNDPDFAFGSGLRRLFGDAFEGRNRPFGGFFGNALRRERHLPADLYAGADSYRVRLELPGVKKEDVSLALENSILSVEAKYHREESDDVVTLSRSLAVPEDIDAGAISAKLENGVLDITLPKAEVAKSRTIEVS